CVSLRAGQPRRYARLDAADLVDSAVALVGPAAKHHQVELRWSPAAGPLAVRGDASELEQVFINLLTNALEAAVGYGRADVTRTSQPEVAVVAAIEGHWAVIEVTDNGPGPAAGVRDSLFEPLVTDK